MNNETTDLILDKLNSLPETLKKFISDNFWKQSTSKIARQFNLKEDQAIALENEVFFTLLCFEPPSDFKETIKKELGLDENAGRRISDSINGTVFASVMGEIKNAWGGQNTGSKNYEVGSMEGKEKTEYTPIDTLSPEKIQQAMRPAGQAPANLPIGETQARGNPHVIHDYVDKSDPYREPLE